MNKPRLDEQDEQILICNYMKSEETKSRCFWCLALYRSTKSKTYDLIRDEQREQFKAYDKITIETVKQCGRCGEICMFVHNI